MFLHNKEFWDKFRQTNMPETMVSEKLRDWLRLKLSWVKTVWKPSCKGPLESLRSGREPNIETRFSRSVMAGGGWSWIMIVFKGGLKMGLVEYSNSDNSLKSNWLFGRADMEWTRNEAFSTRFSKFNCLCGGKCGNLWWNLTWMAFSCPELESEISLLTNTGNRLAISAAGGKSWIILTTVLLLPLFKLLAPELFFFNFSTPCI